MKILTAPTPLVMKIKVVASPDDIIFTFGAKRFQRAGVLKCCSLIRFERWRVDGKPCKTVGPTLRGAARSRSLQEGTDWR